LHSVTLNAAGFDERTAFGIAPGRDLDAALKRAEKEKKRVFLVFWNSKEKTDYPGLDIKYFTQLQQTKKLLTDHFIIVLLDRGHKDVKKYLDAANTEKAQYVLITPAGDALKQGAMNVNENNGLKIVQELVALR
jgi:hypothetical protein